MFSISALKVSLSLARGEFPLSASRFLELEESICSRGASEFTAHSWSSSSFNGDAFEKSI